MEIDWKKKLTSRKFWTAVCTLITNILAFFNCGDEIAVKVTALVMASAVVIAYIIGEGLVDAANAGPVIEIDQPPTEAGGEE